MNNRSNTSSNTQDIIIFIICLFKLRFDIRFFVLLNSINSLNNLSLNCVICLVLNNLTCYFCHWKLFGFFIFLKLVFLNTDILLSFI